MDSQLATMGAQRISASLRFRQVTRRCFFQEPELAFYYLLLLRAGECAARRRDTTSSSSEHMRREGEAEGTRP
jgi:hypothetical protein